MRRIPILAAFVFCALIFFVTPSGAQDIHFSQFYSAPLNLNPALTGIFNGDQRFSAIYRQQWYKDDLVDYLTFSGNYDRKFYPTDRDKPYFFGAGILFNYDQAGVGDLSLAHIGLSGSFTYGLNKQNFLTAGLTLGGSQRQFDQDKYEWGSQYDPTTGGKFPGRQGAETLGESSEMFFDLNAGLNYRWQKNARTKFNLGTGMYHITKPEQQYKASDIEGVPLPYRFAMYLDGGLKLTDWFDLQLHAMHQIQGEYDETIFGGYAKFYVSQKKGREFAFALGFATRLDDALIPKLALEFNDAWRVGISYDYNTSDFDVATDGLGGPEIAVQYIIKAVQPLGAFKICPIY